MSTASVHIVISDRGWILETLASKLKESLPNVEYDTEPDPGADIQYYMTYGTWKGRISRTEVGYFAHVEKDQKTRQKFFAVSQEVDFCVCHSRPYEDMLRESGISAIKTIPPGVDLDRFVPKLKIGVVGRTYHTGRKGEHIVAALMDLSGIEWHFTGTGWPGPALELSDAEMPGFYRSMDYILVPSLYEGGPMSVVEALACGCEVIAPPIGWVPEFPHIEYKTGDAADLRRVLTGLVEKRLELRRSVLHRGWANWVEGHHGVFESLGRKLRPAPAVPVAVQPSEPRSIQTPGIIVHGSEIGLDKGGPSVRAPATAKRLNRLGYQAKLLQTLTFDQRDFDIFHIFNLSRLNTCRRAIEYTRLSNAPVILSTIYLDPSERDISEREIPNLFRNSFSEAMINDEYARLREKRSGERHRSGLIADPNSEFHAEVRDLVGAVDHIICLSEHERKLLKAIGADVTHSSIVYNPVDAGRYASATAQVFQEAYGVSDYVLCVGRLEPRKNQITLLHALRKLDLPVVLIGHAPDPAYKEILKSVAGPNTLFVDRLAPNSVMLMSAFAGARVFCLPSWSEGAPLSALEAGAAGCSMVLSDRSSESEYFAERARYCDPCNPQQMATAIQQAFDNPPSKKQRHDLSKWVAEKYHWDRHAAATAAVYETVAKKSSLEKKGTEAPKIYVDVTSGANRSGPPSGIARVEERYALDLYDLLPGRIVFMVWNSTRRAFIEVTHDQFTQNRHKQMHNAQAPAHLFNPNDFAPYASLEFEPDSILLVLGGAWIRNENYIHSLAATKRVRKLKLTVFVHDVIQGKFKHWFPENIGDEFNRNCRLIVNAADHLIANSQCTLNDLRELCLSEDIICPPVDLLRFGDEIEKGSTEYEAPQFEEILPLLKGKPFVLYVSALDIRKNHVLLYNIWERMLEEHGEKTPNLIMVGSKGWNIDQFLELVNSNRALKKVFHILHGINDATLSWLYRHCQFTVYPSRYEGWGLPVAESLNYGKVCIAGRAGSVPEVAPEVTDLIDPLDFASWYKAVTNYVFNPALLSARREFVTRTYKPVLWRDSAKNLRDILLQVRGRGRSLPVLRTDLPLPFDDQPGNNSREIKIGGWYSPEKDGTWTLGPVATLQFKLAGVSHGPLVLKLRGRGFTLGGNDQQNVTVVCQGIPLRELKWNADMAADIVFVPVELATKLRASDECIIELQIARPLVPANVRPNSADRRHLGVMVQSFGVASAPTVPLNAWVTTVGQAKSQPVRPRIEISHSTAGGLCYQLPLLLDASYEDTRFLFGSIGFICIRFTTAETEKSMPLPIEFRLGGRQVGQTFLTRGQSETRFCVVSASSLREGAILEVAAAPGDLKDIAVSEYGVFTSLAEMMVTSVPTNAVVMLSEQSDSGASKPKIPLVHWGLSQGARSARAALRPIFLEGWSNYETAGLWSDGDRASLLMRTSGLPAGPVFMSFEVRTFRPMRVDVRVNGGSTVTWVFDSAQSRQKVVVHTARAHDSGIMYVEFLLPEAVSPAEIDSGTDTRRLGLMLSSFAIIPLDQFLALAKRRNFPLIEGNTLVNGTSQPPLPEVLAGRSLKIVSPEDAAPLFVAGWSKAEKSGIWTDGDLAYLYLARKPDHADASRPLSLMCAVRPYRSAGVRVRVNGAAEQHIVFSPRKATVFKITLPPASGLQPALGLQPAPGHQPSSAFPPPPGSGYLIEFDIEGAVSPAAIAENTDSRRLGFNLSHMIVEASEAAEQSTSAPSATATPTPSAAAKVTPPAVTTPPAIAATVPVPVPVPVPVTITAVPRSAAPPPTAQLSRDNTSVPDATVNKPSATATPVRFKSVVIDLARPELQSGVRASDWFEVEVHGRWSLGRSGFIEIGVPGAAPGKVKIAAIFRLTGCPITGPRTVSLFVEGKECRSVNISDDYFYLLEASTDKALLGKEKIKLEFRCSGVFNPRKHGISDDNRDLGLHLRSVAVAAADTLEEQMSTLPGTDLVYASV